MPETTSYLHYGTVLRENDIRTTGEGGVVEPVSQSGAVKRPPYSQFRAGILASNTRHHPASGLLAYDICHAVRQQVDSGAVRVDHAQSTFQ